MTDGWLVRWRVRGVNTTGLTGPWSEWQTTRIAVNNPAGTGLGVVPGTKTGDTYWVLASTTPWLYTKVTAAAGAASYLSAEIEHDPSMPDQGAGLIWSGTGTTSYASGSNAWVQVPAGKLTDGWRVRWRVRGVTTTGVIGSWSEWQTATVSVTKPAVAALGMTPGTAGASSWTTGALTPWLFATVTDPQGRDSYLGVEVEHDPEATEQGSGQIWAGTGTTAYPSGSKAWTVIPEGKLSDGWRIRWRVRGVTTSGVNGPWSEWQSATVSALPFQTFYPADNSQVGTLRPTLSAHAQSPVEAKVVYWFQICSGTKDHWTWCESSEEWTKEGTFDVPADKLQWGKTYWWYAKAATSAATVTSSWRTFTTAPQQGTVNSLLAAGTGGREFNHVNGNYTRSVTDLSVAAPGLPLTVTRTYNSLDPRSDGAFGSGWSSRWDMRVQDEGQALSYPSMVGHWRLGDLLGSVYAADASGRKFNAALSAATSLVTGKIGGAIAKSGGAVATAPGPVLRTDDSYTIASWLKLDDRSGAYQVAQQNGANRTPYYLGVDQATGQLMFATYASDTAGSPRTQVLSGVDAPVGRWFHVAGVYDKAAGSIALYLDGTLMKTVTGVPAGWNAAGTTVLGSDIKGAIDDIRMFQKALSLAEIQELAGMTKITPPATVLVTYPDGSQQRFASKGDGTYASPPGTFATLVSLDDGGWRLMDRSAVSYWFDTSGRLTRVSDKRDNSQNLVYGTDGKLQKVTATGGRSLTFAWTGAHVTSVATDPVDGTPITWSYQYDGDKLIKACPPASSGACITYTYTDASRYRSVVLDTGPTGYWRLGGTATALNSKVPSSAGIDLGESDGKIKGTTANATAGAAGALAGSPDTAMTFAGTSGSAYVSLPEATVSGLGGSVSVEAWFKTTGSGTILGYQSSSDSSPLASAPGIYVGTDGKLRGQFSTGTPVPITSARTVNDGVWHHVVLSASVNFQTLFLDGQPVGGLAGKITHTGTATMWDTRIGAGFGSPDWPSTTSSATTFPFAGSIDEVAVYDKPLGLATVRTHYAARLAQPLLTKETQLSGRVHAENTYSADGGRLKTHTDHDGGTWALSDLTYNKDSSTQTSATVTVTDPHNGTLTYVTDALRGYRAISTTDQLGKTTRYAYDTGGYPAKITDPNGNATELSYNARGNLIGKKTCRAVDACSTSYYAYYLNVDNPFDPRNDKVTENRDGRSSGPSDDTYRSKISYTPFGEIAAMTTPATADFPNGRTTTFSYTDGTEAAVGGGQVPGGLLKSVDGPTDDQLTYRYRADGEVAESEAPSGLITRYSYDALGRTSSVSTVSDAHPDGVTTSYAYDALSRVTKITGPGVANEITSVTHTAEVRVAYDVDGNRTSYTLADLTGGDPDRTTTYTYDAYGRTETVTGPEGGVARYAYDHTGALVSYTSPSGAVTHYAYTPRGELASTTLKGWTGSPLDPQPATDVVMSSYAYDPAGRLASETDAMGRTTRYTYWKDNGLAEEIAGDARLNGSATARDVVVASYTYDWANNLVRLVTGGGQTRTDYLYDAANRLTSVTLDPTGLARKASYSYDAVGNVTATAYSAADTSRTETVSFDYDNSKRLTKETVKNGSNDLVTTWTYDDRGLVTELTTPRGNLPDANRADYTTLYRYDAVGQLVELKDPAVAVERAGGTPATQRPVTRYGYNTAGEQTHTVDPEGRGATAVYDRSGRVTSLTASSYTPPGGTALIPKTLFGYDAAGRLTSLTDPRGNTTNMVYDALDRMVRVTDPPAASGAARGNWDYTYTLDDELLSATDPTGARREATYDDLGRQITASILERKPTTATLTSIATYDDAGNLLTEKRPAGDVTSVTRNPLGEITELTDPLGHKSTFAYDLLGRQVKVTDPLGNATSVAYDHAGRATTVKDLDANGNELRARTFDYDADGNLISRTDAEGHTITAAFDALGRLTRMIEPVSAADSITTSFGYDANGAKTRYTDGRGNSTITTYNTLGLVESVVEPATTQHPALADRTWTTTYDAAGNPVSELQPGGVRITRTFDNLDRLTQQSGTGAEAATQAKTFGYDLAGRTTSAGDLAFTLNDRSQLLKTTKAGADQAAFGYDANGRLTQREDAAGTATFTWDGKDRLTTTQDPLTGVTITYDYDNADRLTSMRHGNGGPDRTFGYDALNRLTSDTLKSGSGTELASITYGYDKEDRLTSKTTTGTAGAGTNAYHYDYAGRLTSWTDPAGATTEYGWDAAGNRIKAGNDTFTYDERNRLTSGAGTNYTYTARGTLATETKDGLTKQYSFDAFDRLISDGDVSYTYDALDRITTRTRQGTTSNFLYADTGNDLVAVTDSAGIKQETYSRGAYGEVISAKTGTGSAQFLMADQHGDIVGSFAAGATGLTGSTAYDPFGKVTAKTGEQPQLGYQSEWTDPDTGKVNMHARWYQPAIGGFTSRDTWALVPIPSAQGNRYAYGNADPLGNVDPSGHSSSPVCLHWVSLIGGGAYCAKWGSIGGGGSTLHGQTSADDRLQGMTCRLMGGCKPKQVSTRTECQEFPRACAAKKGGYGSIGEYEQAGQKGKGKKGKSGSQAGNSGHTGGKGTSGSGGSSGGNRPRSGGSRPSSTRPSSQTPSRPAKTEPRRAPTPVKKSCKTCFIEPTPAASDDYTYGVCTIMPQDQCGPAVVVNVDPHPTSSAGGGTTNSVSTPGSRGGGSQGTGTIWLRCDDGTMVEAGEPCPESPEGPPLGTGPVDPEAIAMCTSHIQDGSCSAGDYDHACFYMSDGPCSGVVADVDPGPGDIPIIETPINVDGPGSYDECPQTLLATCGVETVLDSDGEGDDEDYLYRGIPAGHPKYPEASQGEAVPHGGDATPAQHNGGNTNSIYTSWTTDYEDVALDAAEELGPGGLVLRVPRSSIPGGRIVESPDIYGESEVLITGRVTGAEISRDRGPWIRP
ncbi:LamG-like jellyroll fold domain-containing protein [Microbispora siamensis]|uniref:LamG-like jellyroll fold domain-containing protein n=1 Tax=Microbispora siamensis TaxID=564413 RepID=UPI00194F60EC|nr:LamG-like jellyroll fold domain-containing protein [Microbispora siamensis]